MLKKFLLLVALPIIALIAAPTSPAVAASPQENCESANGLWKNGTCVTQEESCTSAGGTWRTNRCDTVTVSGANGTKIRACLGSSGIWADDSCHEAGGKGVGATIKNVINLLLFLTGIIAVIVIVAAGFRFVTANGESQQITNARNGIFFAAIGLVIAVLSYAFINFILDNI